MEYQLHDENGQLLATGESTQVMYDYTRNASKPIPPEVRSRIEAFEPTLS
jgi:acyl-CoA thioesterase FadM